MPEMAGQIKQTYEPLTSITNSLSTQRTPQNTRMFHEMQ